VSKDIDVFISGETVDLCVASEKDWVINQWYKWFNDSEVTKNLAQGGFPNTHEQQTEFFRNSVKDRLILMIRPKNQDFFIGVISLSGIDFVQRQCDTAMVIGKQLDHKDSMYFGLEAKALITEHAFIKLGMERVNSSQITDLLKWQRTQILFGFQVEGIQRNKFRKGYKVYDVIVSSCLLSDYLAVIDERKNYWPGKLIVYRMMRELPRCQLIENLIGYLNEGQDKMVEQRVEIQRLIKK
jgi:RimJ/RimL family protein N-acetyltransferase